MDPALAVLFWSSFIGFIVFSPTGLVGVAERLSAPFRRREIKAAAMATRRTAEGLSLPQTLLRGGENKSLVLSARNLDKNFGGIHAVRGFDLSVLDKTLHALIGPNGAGKTTAFNVLSGLYRPDAGSVDLEGKSIGDSGRKISRGPALAVRFRSPICLPA